MKKVLAVLACAIALTGCLGGEEGKMKSVCEGIAKSQAANPKSVNLNEVVVASREVGKADFVRNYYGAESGISESAKAVMDIMFAEGGKGAKQYAVEVDYTDSGQVSPSRDKAICIFIKYGDELSLTSFSVKGISVGKEKIFDYFLLNNLPKGISSTGVLD